MPSDRFDFPSADGHTLAGRLDRPEGPARTYALFAHCFTCTKDIFAAGRIARTLTDQGIGVLRFDFTGLGSSEGEFENTHFTSNVQDLQAAAAHMRAAGMPISLLVGHSLGGAAVLAAAGDIPEVRAVATIGAPHDPAHVEHHFQNSLEEIEQNGIADVRLVGRPFRIRKQFLDDIRAQTLDAKIAGLRKALLVFHSPIDAIVGIDNASKIFAAAKHPKSFVSLDQADHLLSKRADADYVATVLAAWVSRYLVESDSAPSNTPTTEAGAGEGAPAAAVPEGTVVVRETGQGTFQQAVQAGRHGLLADEPARHGGGDTGPGPYDYLLTALGTCTAMTIRMYADRKGIPLQGVVVTLAHEKVHAQDCAECETKTGKIDRITRRIALSGSLDGATRGRLLEIADKCPVHRTLHSEVQIVTEAEAETGP